MVDPYSGATGDAKAPTILPHPAYPRFEPYLGGVLYTDLLLTSASVAATLAGFIGVVFVLGSRSEGDLSNHELSAVFHLLYTSLRVLFFALVMAVFLASPIKQGLVWQVGNGAYGLYHLVGAGKGITEASRGEYGVRKVIAWPIFIGSFP